MVSAVGSGSQSLDLLKNLQCLPPTEWGAEPRIPIPWPPLLERLLLHQGQAGVCLGGGPEQTFRWEADSAQPV